MLKFEHNITISNTKQRRSSWRKIPGTWQEESRWTKACSEVQSPEFMNREKVEVSERNVGMRPMKNSWQVADFCCVVQIINLLRIKTAWKKTSSPVTQTLPTLQYVLHSYLLICHMIADILWLQSIWCDSRAQCFHVTQIILAHFGKILALTFRPSFARQICLQGSFELV